MDGKKHKSRSHCSLIHRLLFSSSIPKLSYTRILNSASIAARALGFVVEGKRRSVEPSVVACSCGLAPLCFDGLHLLPSEQPAIQGKKWERKEEAWRKFPHTHSVWHSRRAKTNRSTDNCKWEFVAITFFLPQQKNSLQMKTIREEEGKEAWIKFPHPHKCKKRSTPIGKGKLPWVLFHEITSQYS